MNEQTHPPAVRVFIALAPPDHAKDELARALRPGYRSHPGLRWNRIEDWHITLAFLGRLPSRTVPLLRAPLAGVAAGGRAPRLALHGGGTFDDRVVWSGIDGDLHALHALAADVRAAVRAGGVAFEERPLRPHLTLARARRGDLTSAGEIAAALDGFAGVLWPAARLHLVASTPLRTPGPVRYGDVDAWPIGDGAGGAGTAHDGGAGGGGPEEGRGGARDESGADRYR